MKRDEILAVALQDETFRQREPFRRLARAQSLMEHAYMTVADMDAQLEADGADEDLFPARYEALRLMLRAAESALDGLDEFFAKPAKPPPH